MSETVTVMHKIKLQAEAEKGPSIRAQLEESTSNKGLNNGLVCTYLHMYVRTQF